MVEPEVQITLNSENTDPEQQVAIKSKRRQLRARITRSIKRIREFIEQNNHNKTRFDREMAELRRDFERAREFHTQLYDFADESQLPTMDKWENDLTNDVYSIEEETELYLSTISLPEASQTSQIQSTSQNMQSMQTPTEPEIEPETVSSIENNPANEITEAPQVFPLVRRFTSPKVHYSESSLVQNIRWF
jgi:hypothetical protein